MTNLPLASAWDWFKPAASTTAHHVDSLFWVITWICVVFFVLIAALMGLFIVWYRKRPGYAAQDSTHHNNALEAFWSIIPLFLVIWIFFLGFVGYLDMRTPPGDAYEIQVIAKKWNWSFIYPNGVVSPDLHVPVSRPVKLVMSSQDVLHSLYIPAFRVKMDCVPGRYTTMWFEATEASTAVDANGDGEYQSGEGGYDLLCTEYCGTSHSSMLAKVVVYEPGGFETWMKGAMNVRTQGNPVEVGEKLYARRGCSQCHSIDGGDRPSNGGPSFKGHFGKMQKFTNGEEHKMDENYIRESILNPMAKIRSGYKPIMPTYQGQLNDDEIFALIAYIKNLNGVNVEDWPEQEKAEGEEDAAATEAPAAEVADTEKPDTEKPVTDQPAKAEPKAAEAKAEETKSEESEPEADESKAEAETPEAEPEETTAASSSDEA